MAINQRMWYPYSSHQQNEKFTFSFITVRSKFCTLPSLFTTIHIQHSVTYQHSWTLGYNTLNGPKWPLPPSSGRFTLLLVCIFEIIWHHFTECIVHIAMAMCMSNLKQLHNYREHKRNISHLNNQHTYKKVEHIKEYLTMV